MSKTREVERCTVRENDNEMAQWYATDGELNEEFYLRSLHNLRQVDLLVVLQIKYMW